MPVCTHRCKHIHTPYTASCPIILCSTFLPYPRRTVHFSAFLLNRSIVYATQYHRASKSGAQYVTIHLKLSDSPLQYFVHSSLSMNQFQGIYGGIGATLVNFCYNSIQSHSPHYWSLTYDHEELKRLTKTNRSYDVFTATLISIPPSFMKSNIWLPFWNVSPFVKKISSLQASLSKNIISNKRTPAYVYH